MVRSAQLVSLACAALLLAACGGGAGGSASAERVGNIPTNVTILPSAAQAQ